MTENHQYRICSGCKCKYSNTTDDITKDFGLNRLGHAFKTCVKCRINRKDYRNKNPNIDKLHNEYQQREDVKQRRQEQLSQDVECKICGMTKKKKTLYIHQRRYYCQTYNMKEKPEFEEWLLKQDYDSLLWEYKEALK